MRRPRSRDRPASRSRSRSSISRSATDGRHAVMELLRNERVGDGTFDLVWPRHRWHYLSPCLQDTEMDMIDDGMSSLPVSTPGRDLAARALLAATDCTQQRVSELLETSRRSIGRAADTDLTSALQDAAVVAEARSIVAHTARCGSTEHERQAADTWLTEAQHEQRQIGRASCREGV